MHEIMEYFLFTENLIPNCSWFPSDPLNFLARGEYRAVGRARGLLRFAGFGSIAPRAGADAGAQAGGGQASPPRLGAA